jgi:hypothetical protein
MKRAATKTKISVPALSAMIEEATVDAYDESEQATGWFTMFEEHLELPFETTVLGTVVTVVSIDLRDYGQLNAICTRGRHRQAISLAELPLPTPKPAGSEWIEAYRHWLGGR